MPRNLRRGGRGRGLSVVNSRLTRLQNQIKGHEIRPRGDPSAIVTRPWTNVVVPITSSASGIDTAALVAALAAQVGGTANNIHIKLRACQVWGPLPNAVYTATLSPSTLSVRFFALKELPASADVRHLATDAPSGMNRARVGYEWPVSDQNKILRNDDGTNPIIQVSSVGEGLSYIAHFHLVYRTA